jgi:hypothetical protein
MEGKEYLLALNGEPIGISKGVTLEDASHQSPNWDKWLVYAIEGDKYIFHNVYGNGITLEGVEGLESLKVGDYIGLEYTLDTRDRDRSDTQ